MERYAVSWPDVDVPGAGFVTIRFASLREAVPCAVKHGGIIRNMKERPSDGGKTRFYNEPGEWSATAVPWGYARDCFIAAAYTTLLDFDLVKGETLNAAGYSRSDVDYLDGAMITNLRLTKTVALWGYTDELRHDSRRQHQLRRGRYPL